MYHPNLFTPKKHNLIAALLMLSLLTPLGTTLQAQDLVWAKRAGGSGSDVGFGIATDAAGNSYVTGSFNGSVVFGPGEANETIFNSVGSADIFVAKYNSAGALEWAKRAGGTGLDQGFGIATDAAGNSFVTGLFNDSAIFGPGEANETTLTSTGSNEIFVAKYNSTGVLEWAKHAGGTGNDVGISITANAAGNSFVTGFWNGSAVFGPGEANETILTSAGSFDIFVAKYNSAGALEWAKRAGGTSFDQGLGIATDAASNSYVTGLFRGSAVFGPEEANETILTSAGSDDIFVAKYNSTGALEWAKRAGGIDIQDGGICIATDAAGNSSVTGSFRASAVFGSEEANETTLTSAGFGDIFVAKYNSAGALEWAKRAGGTGFDQVRGIAIDAAGNSYVTGLFVVSAVFGPGEANETTLTSTGSNDIFVAKYNRLGTLEWAKRAGGTTQDDGNAIAIDVVGNSFVTGFFTSSTVFGPGEINETTLTSAGSLDIFVAKLAITLQAQLQNIIAAVENFVATGVLNQSQANALIAKLEAAIRQIDIVNNNTAINQLQAFINQVNAFINSGLLTPAQGQLLIDAANAVIDQLNGLTKQGIAGQPEEPVQPITFALAQNYPNPFWSEATSRFAGNPETMINFALPQAGKVTLRIYAETGQRVRTLVDRSMPAGQQAVSWDGRNQSGNTVAAGVYLYQIVVAGENGEAVFSETKRMILLK